MTSNEQEQATNSSKQNDIFSLKFKYFYSENTKNEKLSYLRRKKNIPHKNWNKIVPIESALNSLLNKTK